MNCADILADYRQIQLCFCHLMLLIICLNFVFVGKVDIFEKYLY